VLWENYRSFGIPYSKVYLQFLLALSTAIEPLLMSEREKHNLKNINTMMGNEEFVQILKVRFSQHMQRHPGLVWEAVHLKLMADPKKLDVLQKMEESGGEPDVVDFDANTGEYLFFDCSVESPKGRRSLCYDAEALASRKEYKPINSAKGLAAEMGIKLLSEAQYYHLQKLGTFDTKTSSWLETPTEFRKLGGALFGDWRYGRVFIYHNGAESYYAARGFRGVLEV
jgi:hypothetical protein